MKLIKKLLPIAAVASTAAIVAPIVTSCGAGVKLDGTKIYIPKTEKAKADAEHASGYGEDDAIELWLTDTKNDSNVFIEDELYYLSSTLFLANLSIPAQYKTAISTEMKLKYSDVSVNVAEHLLSATVEGSINLDLSPLTPIVRNSNGSSVGGLTTSAINLSHFKFKLTNAQYVASYNDENERWQLFAPELNSDKIGLDSKLGLDVELNGTAILVDTGDLFVYNNEKWSFDKTHQPKTAEQKSSLQWAYSLFGMNYSYHLMDIEYYGD